MDKTHKIGFKWHRIPYIVSETATLGERMQLSLLKTAQASIFNAVTGTMFAAHNVSIKREDKKKDQYEIYINGTLSQCTEMKDKFKNLKQLDFSKALRKIPFKFKRKVKTEISLSKFERMQEQLQTYNIYFEVEIDEL